MNPISSSRLTALHYGTRHAQPAFWTSLYFLSAFIPFSPIWTYPKPKDSETSSHQSSPSLETNPSTHHRNSPTQFSNPPILQSSNPLVLDFARASLEYQPSRLPSIADKLIGLGTGLTPSGDDFLGGFSFAIHHLQSAYPDLNLTDYKLQIESYRAKTPLISFTLLKDHASGHAIEPLHHILNSILSGESFENISPSVSQLTRIGHSTGWDLLTGLLAGLLITTPSLRGGLVVE